MEKEYELRVTIMGQQVFSVRINSQKTTKGRLDWREAYDELTMEEHTLPEAIRRRCLNLMERLGLVFGCFDLIVTPAGDFVFLEVNEMGQFLFLERYAGVPLLDAFTEFLLYHSADFTWAPSPRMIRYADVAAGVEARLAQVEDEQALLPPESVLEDGGE